MSEHGGWDERYSTREQIWSGEPNGALVSELAGARPGTVLDIGCGEGADAVWLAQQGWQVTAIHPSDVAVERSRQRARAAGVRVDLETAGLLDAVASGRTFDLVCAQYPSLKKSAGQDAERALIDAVSPYGLLLVVHHADIDRPRALLDGCWQMEAWECRARQIRAGDGAQHCTDVVLKARRHVIP